MIPLVLLACVRADPELAAAGWALDAWEQGHGSLEAGDADAARRAFARAREHRDDALLVAWEARAAAVAGDLEGAVELLDVAVGRAPDFAVARYNRAAYLTRLGRFEQAAPDLRRAIEDGAARSLEALEDPDFAPHLDHPAFSFLPRTALGVAVDPPAPTAFLGGEVTLGMRLSGIVRPPISVTADRAKGPLELTSAIEDSVATSQAPGIDLMWIWRVAGAGEVAIGPFEVRAGRYTATLDAVRVQASAPPDRALPPLPPLSLAVPSQKVDGLDAPGARLVDGELRVRAGPRDRVRVTPPAPPAARYERREQGIPAWVVHVWEAAPQVQSIRIESPDGTVRWEGAPAP